MIYDSRKSADCSLFSEYFSTYGSGTPYLPSIREQAHLIFALA
jgi:hypothetical protein